MKARLVQNVIPPEYKPIGEPVTVAAKLPRSREELRAGLVQKDGEEAPRIQIAAYIIEPTGEAIIKRTSGFCLKHIEAAALRDALDQLLTDL